MGSQTFGTIISLGIALALTPLSLPSSAPGSIITLSPPPALANTFIERQIRRNLKREARKAARQAGFRTKLPGKCAKAASKGSDRAIWKCGEQFFRKTKRNGKSGYVPHRPDVPSR